MKKLFRKLWKSFWQPVLNLSFMQWVLAGLMAISIWFIYFTCRTSVTNTKVLKKYQKQPAVFVFWHGRTMMLSPIIKLRRMRSYVVASRHKDGRMMAKLQRLFGLKAVLGSTTEGGVSVLREGVKILRKGGYSLSLSPDGPGGPSLRLQNGAVHFAQMTGAPIIPICFSTSKAWFQNRWDRYLIALPFARITCRIGNPIFVPAKMTPTEFKEVHAKIENAMVRQMREMDKEFNLFKVEQDLRAYEFKEKKRKIEATAKKIKQVKRSQKRNKTKA